MRNNLDQILEDALNETFPIATPVTTSNTAPAVTFNTAYATAGEATPIETIVIDSLNPDEVISQDAEYISSILSQINLETTPPHRLVELFGELQKTLLGTVESCEFQNDNYSKARQRSERLVNIADTIIASIQQKQCELDRQHKVLIDESEIISGRISGRHNQIHNDQVWAARSHTDSSSASSARSHSPMPRGMGLLHGGNGFFDEQNRAEYREELLAAAGNQHAAAEKCRARGEEIKADEHLHIETIINNSMN